MTLNVLRSDADLIEDVRAGKDSAVALFASRHAAFLDDIRRRFGPNRSSDVGSREDSILSCVPKLLARCRPGLAWEACVTTAAFDQPLIADDRSDADLVSALAAGDRTASLSFIARHAMLLSNICSRLAPDDTAKRDAYRDLIIEADLAALFAGYTGKGTWTTFVKAAVINRFLFPRLMRRLAVDPIVHAADFEAYFRAVILRTAERATNDKELARDVVQGIFESFLGNDCAKLRYFAAVAISPGMVYNSIAHLARNLVVKYGPVQYRKRSLPVFAQNLPAFEQDVFRQFYWWQAGSTSMALLSLRHRYPEASEASIIDARVNIEKSGRSDKGIFVVDRETNEFDDDKIGAQPQVLDELEVAAFRRSLFEAAKTLKKPESQQNYLLKRLQGKTPTEIATEMGLSRREVYAVARAVMRQLRRKLSSDPAVQDLYDSLDNDDDSDDFIGPTKL